MEFQESFQASIHPKNLWDDSQICGGHETALGQDWRICVVRDGSLLCHRAAEDFRRCLRESYGLSLPREEGDFSAAHTIRFRVTGEGAPNTCRIEVTPDRLLLDAADPRGLYRAALSLEEAMGLRRAPFLTQGVSRFRQLTRCRSVHSGCGIDEYPDWQLDAIAHAGFTSIELFVKGPDHTALKEHADINDLIRRADSFGLDVMFYSYLRCYKHPGAPDAPESFDSVFGELFRRHPGASGITLVGESADFPSKDPHTSGKTETLVDGIPETLPAPGWYPCCDYPAYIALVRDTVRRVKPDAEIVFSTYNWGYAPEELRRKFLESMPKDVTLQITYDIFQEQHFGDTVCPLMDYSISAEKPGFYFESEARNAHAIGLKHIRCTANLAGCTWDVGDIPYFPAMFRWAKRMQYLKQYLLECGVDAFYENHHYGWWPNPCNDLAKVIFATEEPVDAAEVLRRIAVRDYGDAAAPFVQSAWHAWSSAMDHYIGSNEDQYGPWRTGPSYPFIFQPNISRTMSPREIAFPTAKGVLLGNIIIKTLYQPYENENQTPGPLRVHVAIRELAEFLKIWDEGLSALGTSPIPKKEREQENLKRLKALGEFIRHAAVTVRNIKRFWVANIRLQACETRPEMLAKLDEIEGILDEEEKNVRGTFEAVRCDRRLGWEPSMGYVCDEWHLDWKLRQLAATRREIAAYRKMVTLQ